MVDLFGGLVPAILPVLQHEYGFSLTAGIVLIAIQNLTANGVQIASGGLRSDRHEPFFLALGIVFAALIALIPLIPPGPAAFFWMALITVAGGAGIAVVHPEALRAVHVLHRLPSSFATAFFMAGGYCGFAGGAFVASLLVETWGLKGLCVMLACPVLGLGILALTKVRLAVEDAGAAVSGTDACGPRIPFVHLMIMAVPICTASAIIPGLLPTYLYGQGLPLSFGGMSVLLFGAGGAIGGLVWGAIAHRLGHLRSVILSLSMGTPLLMAYFAARGRGHAVFLLILAGFCVYASYPLIVTMARYSRELKLGQRMGLIVGGVWGLASLIFMALGPLAEKAGVGAVLRLAWIGYLVPVLYCLVLARKLRHKRGNAAPPCPYNGCGKNG